MYMYMCSHVHNYIELLTNDGQGLFQRIMLKGDNKFNLGGRDVKEMTNVQIINSTGHTMDICTDYRIWLGTHSGTYLTSTNTLFSLLSFSSLSKVFTVVINVCVQ